MGGITIRQPQANRITSGSFRSDHVLTVRVDWFNCLPLRVQNNSADLRSPMNSTNSFATFAGKSISRSPFSVLR